MDKKLKIKLIVSGAVAVGAFTYILIQRSANKKLIAQIQNKIDTGIDEMGAGYDLGQNPVVKGTFLDEYAKTHKGYALYTAKTANEKAAELKAELGTNILPRSVDVSYVDEEKVFNIIKTIPTKVKLSQVATAYQTLYGVTLWDVLQRIDDVPYGTGWLGLGQSWLPKIEGYIKSLPDA